MTRVELLEQALTMHKRDEAMVCLLCLRSWLVYRNSPCAAALFQT
jgi:hypothetical protein